MDHGGEEAGKGQQCGKLGGDHDAPVHRQRPEDPEIAFIRE
jgi:hypothetical protein